MPHYIALIDYTPQGLAAIQDSPQRAAHFVEHAAEHGVQVKQLYWTAGSHDGVLIVDAPDDQSAASLFLSLSASGNVRTKTMRAWDQNEFPALLAKK